MQEDRSYKVYKYTCKVNGKVYIGQTKRSLERRANSNGSGYQTCPYFGKAIEKYGWDNFVGEVLEDNLTLEEANELETKYILEYDSTNRERGYNIMFGGDNREVPESVKFLIKESLKVPEVYEKMKPTMFKKGEIRESSKPTMFKKGEIRESSKPTMFKKGNIPINAKRTICLETGKIYTSTGEASREMCGKSKSDIYKCCRGKQKTCFGYHWVYLEDYNSNPEKYKQFKQN